MASLLSKYTDVIVLVRKQSYGYLYSANVKLPHAYLLSKQPGPDVCYDADFITYAYNRDLLRSRDARRRDTKTIPHATLIALHKEVKGRKIRGGTCDFTVYDHTEAGLDEFLTHCKNLGLEVLSVSVPTPALVASVAAHGNVELVKRIDPEYTHRIELTDKKIGKEVKKQIYRYLESLGDVIQMTSSIKRTLNANSNYLYGCWFRTKDESVTTYLSLISPGCVKKITKVVRSP